jgi:predicted ArsR family transcriptional regulator
MKRRWPSYLVPLKHDYPLGWRCATVLAEITDDGVTINQLAQRMGLDYYAVRQAVRRLERRGLIEPVATRRYGSRGSPELVWVPSPDGGYLGKFAAFGAIGDTG